MFRRHMHWHAFWQNAYSGGGFTLGAGYLTHVSSYNLLDVRASFTPSGYKRIESQFFMPEVFGRRGTLSVLGGWREATQVGFYGFGMTSAVENRVNYGFKQPYLGATLEVFPARNHFVVRGDAEVSQWNQGPGAGDVPSVETGYTPATLPGLGAAPVYLHSQVMAGIDTRPARGYTRRGGFYGVTVHDYTDRDEAFGFQQVDYEVVQHCRSCGSLGAFAPTRRRHQGWPAGSVS